MYFYNISCDLWIISYDSLWFVILFSDSWFILWFIIMCIDSWFYYDSVDSVRDLESCRTPRNRTYSSSSKTNPLLSSPFCIPDIGILHSLQHTHVPFCTCPGTGVGCHAYTLYHLYHVRVVEENRHWTLEFVNVWEDNACGSINGISRESACTAAILCIVRRSRGEVAKKFISEFSLICTQKFTSL